MTRKEFKIQMALGTLQISFEAAAGQVFVAVNGIQYQVPREFLCSVYGDKPCKSHYEQHTFEIVNWIETHPESVYAPGVK